MLFFQLIKEWDFESGEKSALNSLLSLKLEVDGIPVMVIICLNLISAGKALKVM